MLDLYAAFHSAKRHKSNRLYVKTFERRLDANLRKLCDELWSHRYVPEPSSCFIVEHPKKREVFAAQFRDRVVHHLYYNYTHKLLESTFIQDSYSCIDGRGTHYGIDRMRKHILQESDNYQRKCYVLKLDIRGYFMHINRQTLLDITIGTLRKMASHKVDGCGEERWDDVLDMDFIEWLTGEIVMLNPKEHCHIVWSRKDWIGLDRNKSLFYTDEGCGLPIGNLTSQLLSNVYMNDYDQFMKRELHCRHYGRYVDDSYVVSHDREWLLSLVPKVRDYLKENLGLDLHMGKVQVMEVKNGVEFLGAYIKPYRTYMSHASIHRAVRKIERLDISDKDKAWRSLNSFLGVFAHFTSYNIRCRVFLKPRLMSVGIYNRSITKMEKVSTYFNPHSINI